jgi:Uma2 family endonuclease
VADSSLNKDRHKAELYARAGIEEYWIVNLVEHVVEVHRAPEECCYGDVRRYVREDAIRLSAFPDIEIEVKQFLPHE